MNIRNWFANNSGYREVVYVNDEYEVSISRDGGMLRNHNNMKDCIIFYPTTSFDEDKENKVVKIASFKIEYKGMYYI